VSQHLTTAFVAACMRAQGYRVAEGPDVDVTGGAADSRKVTPGDLFTAFPGENSDGNMFVADALRNGAVAAICERAPEGEWPGRTVVVADNATRAVGELAHAWRMECGPRVVGITGTVGKTTAKELTAATLSQRFRTHKSEGNFNSREGLPLAVMSLRRDHQVSVLEMGMDSPGEIAYLCDIGQPTVGVVLNIGLTHVSKLGSIEAIEREKLSLARWLPENGTAVLNFDDERIARGAAGLRCKIISFGSGRRADGPTLAWALMRSQPLEGSRFTVTYDGVTARGRSPVPGDHTIPAAMTAIGVSLALGMNLTQAVNAVKKADVPGRARMVTNPRGATIIDDRYNSSPESLAGALRMLANYRRGRRIAVIGRMAELGEHEEAEHRKAGAVAGTSCDVLAAVGAECEPLAAAAREAGLKDVRWFETKEEAAADVVREMRAGDVVLVKASRGAKFETILPQLESAA
jgi:UDP-N-acetylmuramoyl-tripeptide--D-alanyl-D-alanine ligase